MKKLLIAIGLGLISGSLWAACVGPFCYDDTGASVNGLNITGNGYDVPLLSSTSISTMSGFPKGRVVGCNTCANTPSTYALCLATATTTGSNSWIVVATSSTICK